MNKVEKPKGQSLKFFKNVKTEMKKVVWPTKKELVSATGVVIFTCIVFSIGIWVLDSIFNGALKAVLSINL
ncbi:MAG: preprotein translocase subunit SecE [Epulopiscium sp.]|nr:preprotein translocase subunit SecE [Candidatus Epulonipiscium sp.]